MKAILLSKSVNAQAAKIGGINRLLDRRAATEVAAASARNSQANAYTLEYETTREILGITMEAVMIVAEMHEVMVNERVALLVRSLLPSL